MKTLKRLLFNNWGLKLISLIIAFLLWGVVISIDDPVDDKTFNNIRVNLVNTQLVTDKNMVYEILDGTGMLRSVSFEAPKSIREEIEAGDIIAEADLNELTTTDTVPITFSCPKYGQNVTNISGNISYVKLNIEEKAKKWIDISYNLVGEVANGYVISSVAMDQNRMEIEGPASKVAEVSKAVVDINIAGISRDMSLSADVHLKNVDGANLNYATLAKSTDRVKVNVVVYATKEVPIEYEVSGEPAEGYAAIGKVDITPETVLIAGPNVALANTSAITIPAEVIDITGATEDYEVTLGLRRFLSNSIMFADKEFDGNATIKVYVEELVEENLKVTARDVQIINKPSGMIAGDLETTKIPDLRIRGLAEHVSAVEVNDLNAVVDVAAWMERQGIEVLTSGTYLLPVTFEIPENVEQIERVVVAIEFITPEELAARNQATQTEQTEGEAIQEPQE